MDLMLFTHKNTILSVYRASIANYDDFFDFRRDFERIIA